VVSIIRISGNKKNTKGSAKGHVFKKLRKITFVIFDVRFGGKK
jgi:hypothetical protein